MTDFRSLKINNSFRQRADNHGFKNRSGPAHHGLVQSGQLDQKEVESESDESAGYFILFPASKQRGFDDYIISFSLPPFEQPSYGCLA